MGQSRTSPRHRPVQHCLLWIDLAYSALLQNIHGRQRFPFEELQEGTPPVEM
jgi:hypothetical protein